MLSDCEILDIVHGISGRHDEAVKFGEDNGIKRCYVEVMRNVFGISEPTRSVTDIEVGIIVDKYLRGISKRDIARQTNVCEKTVYRKIKKFDDRKWFWSQEDDATLQQLIDDGYKASEICVQMKRSKQSVYNRISFLRKKSNGVQC